MYNLDEEGNVVITNAQYLTDSNGEYKIQGLVPGEYYIQYQYGKYDYTDTNDANKVINIQTKMGDIPITTQDYKSTIVNESKYKVLIENNKKETPNGRQNLLASGLIHENESNPDDIWYWYRRNENSLDSSAVDDKEIRNNINNYLSTINYATKTDYENSESNEYKYVSLYRNYGFCYRRP